MNLDRLKENWKLPESPASNEVLARLLRAGDQSVRRVKWRLIIETIGFLVAMLVFWNGFDGAQRPILATVLLVAAFAAVIMNDLLTLMNLQSGMYDVDVITSLQHTIAQLRVQSWVSPALLIIANSCWIGFFLAGVPWRSEKWIYLSIFAVILVAVGLITHFWWRKRFLLIRRELTELEDIARGGA